MAFVDKTLVCQDCGKEFVFSASEQEFFEKKGFQPPKRCPDCRKAKKQSQQGERRNYEIVCSRCGQKGTVPFRPRNPEGLLCEKCFKESRQAGSR
jgi:CxxC-x17-CxxC domain-containing protein